MASRSFNNRRSILRFGAAMAPFALSPLALAQAASQGAGWVAPMKIVVPYPPGGSSDRAARLLAQAMQERGAGTVIVDNIAGAGGRLGARQVAGLPADANVLLLANPAIMSVAPLVYKNSGYEPAKDFKPLSQISRYEFALAVGPAVPVRELRHLLAWVKANPQLASFGVPASGSLPHFFALMLGQAAGAPITIVPFKGSAPMVTDLIGGHLPIAIDSVDALQAQHEAGKLRILATSGAKPAMQGVPTFESSDINVRAVGWNVLYAKAGMPAAQVAHWAANIHAAMQAPALQKAFADAKAEPVVATQSETEAMLRAFDARWLPVIRQSGLQFDN